MIKRIQNADIHDRERIVRFMRSYYAINAAGMSYGYKNGAVKQ
jgi:hypothetical protein